MNKKATMVFDLQWGSCGKGQIAGTWALKNSPDTAVTANGPNAGHSFHWGPEAHQKVVFTVLPCASIVKSVRTILIGPGSVINIDRLRDEIETCINLGLFSVQSPKAIVIHPRATVVLERHREAEKELVRIGSTMKGTAEAAIEKIRRGPQAPTAQHLVLSILERLRHFNPKEVATVVDEALYMECLDNAKSLVIEGSQGHSLGLHTKFYPYTTSRDVSVHQLLADCRIPYNLFELHVIGVCRTYPIRVANRYDGDGKMVGSSGPHYDDQMELDWKRDLNREPELTTVTKLPRRIFTFSYDQLREACFMNRPSELALTFADYLDEAPGWLKCSSESIVNGMLVPTNERETFGVLSMRVKQMVDTIERLTQAPVNIVSYGPHVADIARIWSRSSTHNVYRRWNWRGE